MWIDYPFVDNKIIKTKNTQWAPMYFQNASFTLKILSEIIQRRYSGTDQYFIWGFPI